MNEVKFIMYHYVRQISLSKYKNINGMEWNDFENQVNYLLKNHNIISYDDLFTILKNKDKVPKNSVVLSFDDGYKDHFKVYRFLKKKNISGIFFPVASVLKNRTILDVNKIHFILNSTTNYSILINELHSYLKDLYKDDFKKLKLDLENKYMLANRWDQAEVNYIKRVLQVGISQFDRSQICDILFKKYVTTDTTDFSNELYLSSNDIIEMSSDGMEIGSHGYSHNWLNSLNKFDQEIDIDLSLNYFNNLGLCKKYFLFCYPYGGYDKNTIDILRKKGCDAAFTCKPENHNFSKHNILEIRRHDTNDIDYKA